MASTTRSTQPSPGSPSRAATRPSHRVNDLVGVVFGAVYLLVGFVGFAVTGGRGWADPGAGRSLLGFAVNPLHDTVHVVVGLALLAGGLFAGSRVVNGAVGAVYLVVGVLGLFIDSPSNSANILALNGADNVLHLASAVLLLAVALTADRTRRRARA